MYAKHQVDKLVGHQKRNAAYLGQTAQFGEVRTLHSLGIKIKKKAPGESSLAKVEREKAMQRQSSQQFETALRRQSLKIV